MSVQQIIDRKNSRVIARPYWTDLSDLSQLLAAENIGSVLLTDEAGQLAGIISERDIIKVVAARAGNVAGLKGDDIMTRSLVICAPDTELSEVLALMSDNAIRHLPVLRNDELVGVISIRDVLDFQKQFQIAEIERRAEDARVLQETYETLETAFEKRTEEFKSARLDAENANRAKTEFLAHMSHELRTPLNAIIGFSEIMSSQAFGPIGSAQYLEYSGDILSSGQHLLSIINDLLDLSKVEAGKDDLYEENIFVTDIARAVINLVQGRAQQQGVTIRTEFDDDLPALRADQRKLKQVLTNLVTNAVKFTEVEGVVTIKVWCKQESGYVIQVVDTGIGIAPENIPVALAQFGQIENTHKREQQGTGLGLPLSKALVELHGGTLDLQSTLRIGTTATVRFPATRIQAY